MTERDSEDDERDDDLDDDEEESPPPPKAKPKASVSKPSGSSAKASGSSRNQGAAATAMMPTSRATVIGIIALAVGGSIGWFGHIQKAKAALRVEAAAAPVGSGAPSGPCGAWQVKICAGTGAQSAACQEAKAAADLLLPSTCEVALGATSETLARVKVGRASCEKLVGKICKDLEPGSKTCDMVKDRTPSFPRERCDQMLQNYDKVIGELKQMDAQGGMQMGGPQHLPPGGAPPGGMPPGGMPHGGMPRITIPQSAP